MTRHTSGLPASARRELLDSLGLTAADQDTWSRVTHTPTLLPPLFRTALFYAPEEGTRSAAVIFADAATLERAGRPSHAADRTAIAARIARIYRRPSVDVRYFDVAGIRALREQATGVALDDVGGG